jgi:hypothetical protein
MGVGTGRNKLIINHLGRLFVTSDAATIIREIEVAHPAAKLLVMASTAQETEVSYSCKAWAVWEAAGRGEGWRTRG